MTTTAAPSIDRHDARAAVTRTGLAGRSLYYLLLGVFAADLALGSDSTGDRGAIERVASAPFGRFVLIALIVTVGCLVAWKVVQAVSGDRVEGSDPSDRAKYTAKAVAYLAVAATAVSVLASNWSSQPSSSGGSDSKEQATATVLEWPGGQVLVMAFGFGIVAFGLYEVWRYGIDAAFWHRFETTDLDDRAHTVVEWSGRAGYVGKGVITAVVGGLLVTAGFQHDPNDATGLSGALDQTAEAPWGVALLCAIAVGLVLFAVFSAIEARYRPT